MSLETGKQDFRDVYYREVFMRKKLAAAILLAVSLTAGCGKEPVNLEKACVGVVETNSYREKSRLLIYDENLSQLTDVPLKYASVGSIFYNLFVDQQELYVIPQGSADRKDEKKALQINLTDLKKKTYDIEQPAMNDICADETYIYTCNTLNGDSYINRCRKEDQSVKTQTIAQMHVSKIVCADGRIYAFGTKKAEHAFRSYIIILDEELRQTDQIDISECGSSHYKAIVCDGNIFFSNNLDANEESGNTVSIFSIKDKTIDTIVLNQNCPWDLAMFQDFLIISHYTIGNQKNGCISLYNLDTQEVREYPLEHVAEQMTIKEDNIYILAKNCLYQYKITEGGIEYIKELPIDLLRDGNYCSGIFAYGMI